MGADHANELEAFHQFLGEQLSNGGSAMTPEESLSLWRAQHPTVEELQDSVQAVKEALDDMEAGDRGQPLDEFLAEFRDRNGRPA